MENRTPEITKATASAKENATKRSISPRGGWIRVAKVESFATKGVKYVLAVRNLATGADNDSKTAELGCSCPDWVYRKRGTTALCKHQEKFLANVGGGSPTKGLWMFRAGKAFLSAFRGEDKGRAGAGLTVVDGPCPNANAACSDDNS